MNHTQTIEIFDSIEDCEEVARKINASPKPQRVFCLRNGKEYEIRPVSPVSRKDFNTLCSISNEIMLEIRFAKMP